MTDRKTERQTDRQADRQTDRQTDIYLPNGGNRLYSEAVKITAQVR